MVYNYYKRKIYFYLVFYVTLDPELIKIRRRHVRLFGKIKLKL
jgi:hypothetical protein